MKFQLCTYTSKRGADWKQGLASMKAFGLCDVKFIVDAETGERPKRVYDYRLMEGPLCYITTDEDRESLL